MKLKCKGNLNQNSKAIIIVILFFSHLLSCTTLLIKPIVVSAPSMNWVGIHKDPHVGDYAIYRQSSGNEFRLEVLNKTSDGYYEISQRFTSLTFFSYIKSLGMIYTLKEFAINLVVSKDGWVKRAYYMDVDSKERTPLRVGVEGDPGFIKNPVELSNELIVPNLIKTPAGEFIIDRFRVYQVKSAGLGTFVDVTQVQLVNPNVMFGIVKLNVTTEIESPLLDIVQTMQSYRPIMKLTETQKFIIDFIQGDVGSGTYKDEVILIEQGKKGKKIIIKDKKRKN